MSQESSPAAPRLAEWVVALEPDDVPARARRAVARHLLDGVGCALAAQRDDVAAPTLATARRLTAPAEATVIGTGERLPAPVAAFANAVLVHAHDFDDTHAGGLVHATAAVLPAAFAVGEEVGASGLDVMTAAAAGYEVVCRLAAAAPHAFHARGLHATSVCGVFAAAAVAARLYGATSRQVTDALGIAGSAASGSLEFLHTGSSTKQLHPGLAAQAGLTAARLAVAGATGPETVLDGEHGLYATLGGAAVDLDPWLGSLGVTWEVEQITIKPYPACQLVHAPLDALAAVLDRIEADAVERIEFDVPADSGPIVCTPRATKVAPRSPYEAKFSLPWSAAALVLDGRVDLGSYEPRSIERREVASLAERIDAVLVANDGVAADAPGVVRVHLAGGGIVEGRVECSRGGPGASLSDDSLVAKFTGNGGTASAAATLLDLERLGAGELATALTAGAMLSGPAHEGVER